jgi:CHASE3 domain sensor protein
MEAQKRTVSLDRDQSLERQEEKKKQSPSMLSTLQDSEEDTNKNSQQRISEGEHEYITGFKFVIVMVSVTMVIFLMLLDVSIIVTVKTPIKNYPP